MLVKVSKAYYGLNLTTKPHVGEIGEFGRGARGSMPDGWETPVSNMVATNGCKRHEANAVATTSQTIDSLPKEKETYRRKLLANIERSFSHESSSAMTVGSTPSKSNDLRKYGSNNGNQDVNPIPRGDAHDANGEWTTVAKASPKRGTANHGKLDGDISHDLTAVLVRSQM